MFNMDKKNSEYRNDLAKDLKEIRAKDSLSEDQTKIINRKNTSNPFFQPKNRRLASQVLDTYKNRNAEMGENMENILKLNVDGLLKEEGDNAIFIAKKYIDSIKQFAHLNGFLSLLSDNIKEDVIKFTQDRVYKLKDEDTKKQFLILRKYFDLQDFIEKNYYPATKSSLDVRSYPGGRYINKHPSLDTYDNKGKVFPNRK